MKWEYRIENTLPMGVEEFNQLGNEGWELVQVVQFTEITQAVFKRLVDEGPCQCDMCKNTIKVEPLTWPPAPVIWPFAPRPNPSPGAITICNKSSDTGRCILPMDHPGDCCYATITMTQGYLEGTAAWNGILKDAVTCPACGKVYKGLFEPCPYCTNGVGYQTSGYAQVLPVDPPLSQTVTTNADQDTWFCSKCQSTFYEPGQIECHVCSPVEPL